ncbi:hypothetical protein VP01_4395g1 [Puccinia sorghi]|uniref:Uncharacterized protein n=1 Tax=Puccinia sorghi TaxID=27349 RepID=A0A0L6UQI6_9BASI|nr:hypothetical protein VP01_4395g1 [Puccinia sorghi]
MFVAGYLEKVVFCAESESELILLFLFHIEFFLLCAGPLELPQRFVSGHTSEDLWKIRVLLPMKILVFLNFLGLDTCNISIISNIGEVFSPPSRFIRIFLKPFYSQLDFHFSSFILPHSFAIYLSTFSINPTISQPQPQHSHSTINTIKSILKYQIDLLHIFCLVRSTPKFVFSSSQLTWFSHSCRLFSSSPSPVSAHSISLPLHDPMLVISSLFIFYCLCSNLFLLSILQGYTCFTGVYLSKVHSCHKRAHLFASASQHSLIRVPILWVVQIFVDISTCAFKCVLNKFFKPQSLPETNLSLKPDHQILPDSMPRGAHGYGIISIQKKFVGLHKISSRPATLQILVHSQCSPKHNDKNKHKNNQKLNNNSLKAAIACFFVQSQISYLNIKHQERSDLLHF